MDEGKEEAEENPLETYDFEDDDQEQETEQPTNDEPTGETDEEDPLEEIDDTLSSVDEALGINEGDNSDPFDVGSKEEDDITEEPNEAIDDPLEETEEPLKDEEDGLLDEFPDTEPETDPMEEEEVWEDEQPQSDPDSETDELEDLLEMDEGEGVEDPLDDELDEVEESFSLEKEEDDEEIQDEESDDEWGLSDPLEEEDESEEQSDEDWNLEEEAIDEEEDDWDLEESDDDDWDLDETDEAEEDDWDLDEPGTETAEAEAVQEETEPSPTGDADLDGDGDLEDMEGIEGIQEAVNEAEDISEFFEQRTTGEVEIDELREIEGFFEPGEDLEEQFSEGKLETLLSEAKQGVAEFEGMEGYVEHERYWVNKPYAYVSILYSDAENDYLYYVVEPKLNEYEQAVRKDLEERLRDVLMYEDLDKEMHEEEILEEKARKIIGDYGIDVSQDSMHKILYYLVRDYVYDGKIDPIMRDPGIEDVSCDGHNVPIFVYHEDYRDLMTNVEFEKDKLDSYVIKLAQKSGKHISVADPLVDASTPDGSRVQMTLGREVTDRGSTFTIRKFNEVPFTPIDLIKFNTFSLEQMAYLWTCIENNKSLIFAGGTASGKTTSMNAVTLFIPPKSKVISIEDTREVTLPHMNWIPSVTRDSFGADEQGAVDEYELLRAALRQRPEYLVVGEVRGEEALTLFQAMSTGHTTYSTMHADSVDSAIHRLENPPISVPRSMLKALDIVSIQEQTFVGGERVRRSTKIVEIIGIDPKTRNIRTDDIFQWDAETDSFIRTGNSSALQEIKRSRGWSDEELERQVDQRREVLQYLLDNDIDGYQNVSKVIQSYIIDPDRIMNQVRNDRLDLEALEDLKTLNI